MRPNRIYFIAGQNIGNQTNANIAIIAVVGLLTTKL